MKKSKVKSILLKNKELQIEITNVSNSNASLLATLDSTRKRLITAIIKSEQKDITLDSTKKRLAIVSIKSEQKDIIIEALQKDLNILTDDMNKTLAFIGAITSKTSIY